MFCAVYRVRHQGERRPREEVRRDRATGELAYEVRLWDAREQFSIMKASLLASDRETYVLPVLDRARIVVLRGPGILISGIELIPRGRSSIKNIRCDKYPQTWWCIPTAPPVERGEPDPAAARADARRRGEIAGASMVNHYARRGTFTPKTDP